jgi:hypothetical protein
MELADCSFCPYCLLLLLLLLLLLPLSKSECFGFWSVCFGLDFGFCGFLS